jgi:hypothetical protein
MNGSVRRAVSARGRVVVLVAAIVLACSACYTTVAQATKSHDPSMRPWWCHSELMPGDPGSQWYLDHGYSKGDLSWDDCLTVSADFDAALAYAQQWPTRGAAEAAGWHAQVDYAEGMGTHHVLGNPLAGTFDPKRPTFLQYDGNTPDAKLVGVSWFVNSGMSAPPAGFPGNNDWWHQHTVLCISSTTGKVIFDGPCPTGVSGTSVDLRSYWLLHAWIVPGWQHKPDVFVGHHPCLQAGGPAPMDDPCWDDAEMMMHP